MARHLGELSWDEVSTLQDALIKWLKAHNVAGSVAEYSLYRAIQDEWAWAQMALQQNAVDNSDDARSRTSFRNTTRDGLAFKDGSIRESRLSFW